MTKSEVHCNAWECYSLKTTLYQHSAIRADVSLKQPLNENKLWIVDIDGTINKFPISPPDKA